MALLGLPWTSTPRSQLPTSSNTSSNLNVTVNILLFTTPKTMSFKASTSPKPLTAKSEAFAAIPSPMPPLSSPSSGAPSSEGEVLETPEPEPQRPARVTLRLDIRKAAEGRKILADLTNTNNRFKARLAADPYPISSMRSTANPNGYVGLKRNNRFKRSIATSFPPNEMATKITADRVDGMCKLLESTNMVDAPAATSTVEVPTVANTAALHTNKNRHRISAVTRAMRRSMFNVTVAKRGRAAGTFTMADKNKIAKSFVSMQL